MQVFAATLTHSPTLLLVTDVVSEEGNTSVSEEREEREVGKEIGVRKKSEMGKESRVWRESGV